MCFSATASFVAGGALGAAGAVTLREAKDKTHLPIAALPLLFGIQQAVEGVVWLTEHKPMLQGIAAFAYVMFSHVLWPFYLPLAVTVIEPRGRRRSILKGFVIFGTSISLWLFWFIIHGPVTASLGARGIIYYMNVPEIPYGLAAYVFVTCFACFFSSHKFIRVFGLALLGSLFISLWAYQQAFYSVWCFFAAILSGIVYAHLKQGTRLWPMAKAKLAQMVKK
jgi:hypothetical protein